MQPYTVALTSCGRFDLLEQTLLSLLPRLDGPCKRLIIGEDSGDSGIYNVIDRLQPSSLQIQVILNPSKMGITRNIDRIYSEVETEWIFHCEDDWEFYRGGFINESFEIMRDESISSVNLREILDFVPGFWKSAGNGKYYITNDTGAGKYVGLHFNPGLRRMRDYRQIGPYEYLVPYCKEKDVSKAYFAAGKRMALLKQAAVRHIGEGRRVGETKNFVDTISRKIIRGFYRNGINLKSKKM